VRVEDMLSQYSQEILHIDWENFFLIKEIFIELLTDY
jgi:hypothetical protein